MKRPAPTPAQVAVQLEAPCLSTGVIRTALVGLVAVVLLLVGLFCFFRARAPQAAPVASPKAAHTSNLRMAKLTAVVPALPGLR
jgi:hypothetical protein